MSYINNHLRHLPCTDHSMLKHVHVQTVECTCIPQCSVMCAYTHACIHTKYVTDCYFILPSLVAVYKSLGSYKIRVKVSRHKSWHRCSWWWAMVEQILFKLCNFCFWVIMYCIIWYDTNARSDRPFTLAVLLSILYTLTVVELLRM